MKKNNVNLSILIPSFDKYSDIWALTAHSISRHWPDCPYPIVLGANGENRNGDVPDGWRYINKGPDVSWSRSVFQYLESMDSHRVLIYLDDFLLLAIPDVSLIDKALSVMDATGSPFVQLMPKEECDRSFDDDFSIVPMWNDYRTSLMPTIWDRLFFMELLRYDFDPWQFERRAGLMKESRGVLFLSSRRNALPFRHCVQKGMVLPWVDPYLKEIAYDDVFAPNRKRMTQSEAAATRNRLSPFRNFLLRRQRLLFLLKLAKSIIHPTSKKW